MVQKKDNRGKRPNDRAPGRLIMIFLNISQVCDAV
jgi:hypothetical protein